MKSFVMKNNIDWGDKIIKDDKETAKVLNDFLYIIVI